MYAIQNKIAKTIITAMTLVAVSSTAMAHDPKFQSEKDRNNCVKIKSYLNKMDAMDHSNMDMSNPSAKAMMQKMEKMHTVYNAHCLSAGDKPHTNHHDHGSQAH